MKEKAKEKQKVTRTVVGQFETRVYSPEIHDSTPQITRYRSGFETITTQIVRVRGEQRTRVIPGLAGDVVTENKIG